LIFEIERPRLLVQSFPVLVWSFSGLFPVLRLDLKALIAIDTFKQALISHAYAFLAPNTTYAQDMLLLMKIYDHFVHFYQHSGYKKDAKVAGSVKIAEEANPQYHARSRMHNLILCLLQLTQP
jgi:hypothetical protein